MIARALFVVFLLGASAPLLAHDFEFTEVLAVLRADGSYQVDVRVDVDALALGRPQSADDAELVAELGAMSAAEFETARERARSTLLRRVRIRFDGNFVTPELDFPVETPHPEDPPSVLGTTARFVGRAPADATEFSFFASKAFQIVHLTIFEQSTLRSYRGIVDPGARSPAFVLGLEDEGVASTSTDGFWRYLQLGFEHIVPKGLDHVLFVLGLFLLAARLRPLVIQVSLFTLAHTVTLALASRGVISLPSGPVEVGIALSIAYVAIENLFTEKLHPWRSALVFGFGLLHGLGFAGVLGELGLPKDAFLSALLGFNLGVEVAQLGIVLVAFVLLGRFQDRPWYRSWVTIPGSVAIGIVGLYWAITRALG